MDRYVLVDLIKHGKLSTYWLAWDSLVRVPVCIRIFKSLPSIFYYAAKLRDSLE